MSEIFNEVYNEITSFLGVKEREVLAWRYGVGGKVLSLRKIGSRLGVSYERIRQIEKKIEGIVVKNQDRKSIAEFKKWLWNFIEKKGGVLLEEELNFSELEKKYIGIIRLFLQSFDNFYYIKKGEGTKAGWNILKLNADDVFEIIQSVKDFLEEKKEPASFDEIFNFLKTKTDLVEKFSLNREKLKSILKYSSEIKKNILNKYGIISWPQISPKNISEKIYLILKKYKKPLHFSKIKELVEKENFDNKKVTIQAIHNELVKNENFVLVGRGIYALKEWGFEKGTVADVIKRILKQSPTPLSKEEIIKMVLQERKVSPKTILVNLYEKPEFIQIEDNLYTLKENTND